MSRRIITVVQLAGLVLCLPQAWSVWALAGEVTLKNGLLIEGKPVPIQGLTTALAQQTRGPTNVYPILMIDTGMQRYYVSARYQVKDINLDADLSRFEIFKLPQRKKARTQMVRSLGGFEATPFDEFGRRTITVLTRRGRKDIVQGVTEITPKYLTVTGLTHLWEHAIATTSVPPPILDAMIRNVTDQANSTDRLSIARFYLQARMYRRADAELERIVKDFPELKDRVEEVSLELRQLWAKQLLGELRRLRLAGQHRRTYKATQLFPTKRMSAAVLREVRELAAELHKARQQADKALALLGELQAQLDDSKQKAERQKSRSGSRLTKAERQAGACPTHFQTVARLRAVVDEQLDHESLRRLGAFLKLADDESLSAAEKLALAYSGWVLGSGSAVTDLDKTIRLWEARVHVLEYLQTDNPQERTQSLAELLDVEGVGLQTIGRMIPLLPPLVKTAELRCGKETAQSFEVAVEDADSSVAYSVLLPPEYSPHHRYPMIVTLRPAERTTVKQLTWWGGTVEEPGQSQRHGYIVIAPEYAEPKQREYDYDARAHYIVLRSIRDARKRFNVDSDRIFLSGHGMGGTAAFDIGMSHPDLFAGVIPITGISDKYCKWYWRNAKQTAWYVVSGELDRDTLERNSRELNRMLRYGYDVVYTEYVGRGYESYYAEIHKLFDWMDLHRRVKYIKEVDVRTLRPGDNRFFWIKAEGLPKSVLQSPVLSAERKGHVRPMKLNARVTAGNTIFISSGADRNTIWLSPKFVDFDKRVTVRMAGRQKFHDFIRPDVAVMLEDLRIRGDRQKLYSVKLVFD